MLRFLKLTWMILWRLIIVAGITGLDSTTWLIGLSLAASAIIVFVLKKDVKIFPIIRLIVQKNPIVDLSHKKPQSTYTTTSPTINNDPFVARPHIDQSTNKGRMSGFEPRFLHNVNLPQTPLMRGTPGKGLSSSGFGQTQQRTGQMGEMNFAKALASTDTKLSINYQGSPTSILNNVHSFWSVSMPNAEFTGPDTKLSTDIDCIFVNAQEILLVDTKFYKSGDVTYASHGDTIYCLDNATGSIVGQPRKMTRNMEIAAERFKKAFPHIMVTAMVVLVPTDSGAANVNNVFWPGQIPAVNIETAMTKLCQFTQYASAPSPEITYKINNLLK